MDRPKLLSRALLLALITILYNIAEGLVSTILGFQDETIALAGFGLDSFVEVASGIGIAHMVLRMKRPSEEGKHRFERDALRITGTGFILLTLGLTAVSVINIVTQHRPDNTLGGIIISGVSILTMWLLMRMKIRVGTALNSAPILADAACTRTCFYLSFVLLTSSLVYEIFKVPYVDSIGALAIAYFAFREGLEALEKARNYNLTDEK